MWNNLFLKDLPEHNRIAGPVSSPQVHQNLFFLKKIALGENSKTKVENMPSARMV
jgi:hypothetical protein